MLSTSQRERILVHLQHGWKLPDSLLNELWEAYEALEQAVGEGGDPPQADQPATNRGQQAAEPASNRHSTDR